MIPNLSIENVSKTSFFQSNAQQVAPLPQESRTIPSLQFHNPEILKDCFLAKGAKLLLDYAYFIIGNLTHKSLPRLEEGQLIRCVNILSKPRVVKGKNNAFEISFTLAELFNHLLDKGHLSIELVGGAVPWILNEYLYSALRAHGIEKPEEMVPQDLLKEFAKNPRDFDFRLFVANAEKKDIQTVREAIVEFLIQKTGLDQETFQNAMSYTVFTQPKENHEDLMSTLGFIDATTGRGVDILVYGKMQRDSLFTQDNLRLMVTQLVRALKENSRDALIAQIKAKTFDPVIVPCSSLGNGIQALFDRVAGIVRGVDITSINCAGWASLLICFLKGERCVSPDFEKELLNKICRSLIGYSNEIDMPLSLYQKLTSLPKEAIHKRQAVAAGYWLEKALDAHLGTDPTAALVLTLQACLSLKKHGYEEAIDDLWALLKHRFKPKPNTLPFLIHQVMNCPKAFDKLITLLEARSLLHMNAAEAKDPAFAPNLIMHNQKPAFQIGIDGYHLLMPFHGENCVPNLIMACHEMPPDVHKALEKLDAYLQPKTAYKVISTLPEKKAGCIAYKPQDFSSLWDRIAAEWILASEVQARTAQGAKIVEESMPDLLSCCPDKAQRMRLIESGENSSTQDKKLFTNMRSLYSKENYAEIPLPLTWAMALVATEDPAKCLAAYELWHKHFSSLNPKVKVPYAKLFISKIAKTRPDLAVEILNSFAEGDILFADGITLLDAIKNCYNKNPIYQSDKMLILLASAATKIYPCCNAENSEFLNWLIEEQIHHKMYVRAYELAETSRLCSHYMRCLKQSAADSWETIATELTDHSLGLPATSKRIEGMICVFLVCKQTQASRWNMLFEKLKISHAKEVCSTAWRAFFPFLYSREGLKGTPLEIAEAWLGALRDVAAHHPKALTDFFGKEEPFLAIFEDPSTHSLKDQACCLICESLLEQSPMVCPDDRRIKLLKLHRDFKQANNLCLAEILSASSSVSILMSAFKIYITLGKDLRAEEVLTQIQQKVIFSEASDEFAEALLTLISRQPKLLSSPSLDKFLFLKPEEAVSAILKSYETQVPGKAHHPKVLYSTLKHLVNLAPLVKDSSSVTAFACQAVLELKEIKSIPKKSDIKFHLDKCHAPLVKLLATAKKYDELFMFLSEMKRLSLDLSLSADIISGYFTMFTRQLTEEDKLLEVNSLYLWFKNLIKDVKEAPNDSRVCFNLINRLIEKKKQKEAETLIPDFLRNLDANQLVECENVHTAACRTILNNAISSKDTEILKSAWSLFWKCYLAKAEAAECWDIVLESVACKYPQAYFQILHNLDAFAASIHNLPEKQKRYNIMRLLTLAAACIGHVAEADEQQKLLKLWINARNKLQPDFESDPALVKEIQKAWTQLGILAGNSQDFSYSWGYLSGQIYSMSSNLGALLQLTRWLIVLFSTPPSIRLNWILCQDEFKNYIEKMNLVLNDQEKMPREVSALLTLITTEHFSPETNVILFSSILIDPPCIHLLEFSSLAILDILKTRNLTQEHRNIFSRLLKSFLDKALDKRYIFSKPFFDKTLNTPFLELGMVENQEHLASIYVEFVSLSYGCFAKAADKSKNIKHCISQRKLYVESIKEQMPFFVENCEMGMFKIIFYCLLELLILDKEHFGGYYKSLFDSISKAILAKHGAKSAKSIEFGYHAALIEEFMAHTPLTIGEATLITDFLHTEFDYIIQSKEVDEKEFLRIFHDFVLYPYNHNVDGFISEIEDRWLPRHTVNVRTLISKAWKLKVIKNPQRLFLYKEMLRIDSITIPNLTPEDVQSALIEFSDHITSLPTYFSTTSMLYILKDPPKGCSFAMETLVYCWQNTLQAAAKIKPIDGTYLFDTVIINLLAEGALDPQDHIPCWKEAAPMICKTAFEELCKSDCIIKTEFSVSSIDVCLRASRFLEEALKHCLDGHAEIYYELVQKLLGLYEIALAEQNLIDDEQNINDDLIHQMNAIVLSVINPSNQMLKPREQVLRAQAMLMWIKMLAITNYDLAEKTFSYAVLNGVFVPNQATEFELNQATLFLSSEKPSPKQ